MTAIDRPPGGNGDAVAKISIRRADSTASGAETDESPAVASTRLPVEKISIRVWRSVARAASQQMAATRAQRKIRRHVTDGRDGAQEVMGT